MTGPIISSSETIHYMVVDRLRNQNSDTRCGCRENQKGGTGYQKNQKGGTRYQKNQKGGIRYQKNQKSGTRYQLRKDRVLTGNASKAMSPEQRET